jgi:stage III sporulation protein SpoIIIAA|tara:strand:- start:1469 stop:2887 length:1419 start_codon:yes stop_codon:yes gene_type:complete
MHIKEDLARLVEILPKSIQETINEHPDKDILIEIVMDLGRRPEARFPTHPEYLSPNVITWQDLDYSVKRLSRFADDNRAGIERTLHRISCIRNRQGLVIGLTCRVGRAMYGTINSIRDLLESGKSILILGKPGVGKTTMVREIARVLANEMEKRVVIIDTSNEIAGDSDVPHIGIGRARRMQVSRTDLQHKVMIEAVENHMPEVIVIDEIGTELEARAAQTIAERGVQLIGTAHGNYLGSLIKNPTLSDLVGGIQYVTLSDEEARRRGTQKSILERKGPSAFQLAIEINDRLVWTIHERIEESVDMILQGMDPKQQVRDLSEDGQLKISLKKLDLVNDSKSIGNNSTKLNKAWRRLDKTKINHVKLLKTEDSKGLGYENLTMASKVEQPKSDVVLIYIYSVSNNLVKKCSNSLNLDIKITENINEAEVILGLKSHLKDNLLLVLSAKKLGIPIYSIQKNTIPQITQILSDIA